MHISKLFKGMIPQQDAAETIVSSPTAEVKTELTEEQVGEILDFILSLNDKYFSDIDLSTNQCKQFVFNISVDMYKDMVDIIEKGLPDILNPMTFMYINFIEYPGFSVARFLKHLMEMYKDAERDIEDCDREYLRWCNDDDDEEGDNEDGE